MLHMLKNLDTRHKYTDTKLLLGTKYVPLRQEFFRIGKMARIMPKYCDHAYREKLSVKMQELVDGRGAGRIAELLIMKCVL